MERTQSSIIVGTARITDETGLEWIGIVAASDLGDVYLGVVDGNSSAARRAADALADDLVEKLQILVGGGVERGEVDHP